MHKVTNVSVLSNIVRLAAATAAVPMPRCAVGAGVQNVTRRVLQRRSTDGVRWHGDEAAGRDAGGADRLVHVGFTTASGT